jgi:hypothetical protein
MSETPLTDEAVNDTALEDKNQPHTDWVTAHSCRLIERRLNDAQAKLSTVFQWVNRNHPDGFIDSQSHLQNLEHVTDLHHDHFDAAERELAATKSQLSRICQKGFGNDDTIGLEPADDYVLRKLAELQAEQTNALELLREIRDDEVNAQDEADKFLRDHQPSKLSEWQALAEGLATAIQERDYWAQSMHPAETQTEEALKAALAAYEAAKKSLPAS